MSDLCQLSYTTTIVRGISIEAIHTRCPRTAMKDGKCVFHLDTPSKSVDTFVEEIKRQSNSPNCMTVDLSYFVFPSDDFTFPRAVDKPLIVEHAKFYGDVSFRGNRFPVYTSFHSTEFLGQVDFGFDQADPYRHHAQFQDQVNFSSVIFRESVKFATARFKHVPEFYGTEFHSGVSFGLVEIEGTRKDQWIDFRHCRFIGDAESGLTVGPHVRGIRFSYSDIRGLVVSTLQRQDVSVEFENVLSWDENCRWYQWNRKKIRDEQRLRSEPVSVIDNYRYLEKYFYDHSDFQLAKHFYISQMVVTRRDPNYGRAARSLNWLYQLISN